VKPTKPFDINNARTWPGKTRQNFAEFLREGARIQANKITALDFRGLIEKIEHSWHPRKEALAAWKSYLGK